MYSEGIGPIKPREAFFGGRTNNIKFYCEGDGVRSEIKYVDFTSLYPFEVSRKPYPVGHPKVVRHNFDTTMSFTGISKCKVLPPRQLRFGVLPVRLDDKLIFPLCSACAKIRSQNSCNHNMEERCIIGAWTTPELRFAIKDGYKVLDVYEELRFDESKYNIFSGYIKLWMKEKQEASGWPDWCKKPDGSGYDSAKQAQYISRYKQHEGIELDGSKIEKNPGRRFIAKLMLNSFWGKFAQRNNMGQTAILKNPEEYFRIIEDASKEITADELINDNTVLVGWKYFDDESADAGNSNAIVAAFVTCYARLDLLTKMKEIEQHRRGRVLYFDTDSIIFEHRAGDPEIETGDYLGQLTSEIEGGDKCIGFVSGGPKNYALKIRTSKGEEEVHIKAKGITLNAETQEKITFSEMRRLVDAYIPDPKNKDQPQILVDQFQIRAIPNKLSVQSRYYQKKYRVVSEKRRIIGNDTLPFGFKDHDCDTEEEAETGSGGEEEEEEE